MPATKLKSTRIIAISLAVILLSIFILAASNVYFLNNTNENLAAIEDFHNRKLDIISRMTHIVRERSLVMLAMYVEEDEWKIDAMYMKFNSLAAEFIQLRDRLKSLGLSSSEQIELDNAMEVIRKTEPLQEEIVDRIRSDNHENLRTDISQKDLPLEFVLLDVFSNITNNIREDALHARRQAQIAHSHALYIVALISITITVMVIFLDIDQAIVVQINGKTVQSFHYGRQTAGQHSVRIQIPSLPAGTYFLLLQNGRGLRIARCFTIIR